MNEAIFAWLLRHHIRGVYLANPKKKPSGASQRDLPCLLNTPASYQSQTVCLQLKYHCAPRSLGIGIFSWNLKHLGRFLKMYIKKTFDICFYIHTQTQQILR